MWRGSLLRIPPEAGIVLYSKGMLGGLEGPVTLPFAVTIKPDACTLEGNAAQQT